MPIFQIKGQSLAPIQQRNFRREKELQALIESNLGPVFNCRFVAEEVYQRSISVQPSLGADGKDPIMVAAGKKAALTRATGVYTFEEHIEGKSEKIKDLVLAVQEVIINLDPAIEEVGMRSVVNVDPARR